jgi:hypothetical protein
MLRISKLGAQRLGLEETIADPADNIQVLKSPDKTLSDEAVQVLAKSPKWAPARQRDMAVRFSYTMPIVFKLQN